MAHPSKIYRLPAVMETTGLCASSVYELISRNLFPKQFLLGGPGSRAVGWDSEAVHAWVADRIASRTEQTLSPTEQEELHALLVRLPEMGAGADTSGMTVDELRGLLRFLQRKARSE